MIRGRYLLAFVIWTAAYAQPSPTDLFLRGYKVIPTPQKISQWAVVSDDNIASRSLLGDLSGFHSVLLRRVHSANNATTKLIRLEVSADAVAADSKVRDQAYRLTVKPGLVVITGNGAPGLYYGVQTFLQLLRNSPASLQLLDFAGRTSDLGYVQAPGLSIGLASCRYAKANNVPVKGLGATRLEE